MNRVLRHPWSPPAVFGVVLAIGAVLRFWNIDAGLPYRIGVDEPVIAERAIHMLKTGDFNPHFFDYPGFYIYLQAIIAAVRFVTAAMAGQMTSIEQLQPDHIFAWTRAVNALLGTLTVLVVYRAGRRWGTWTAVLAAALQAVWLNHVRESHFALTDTPLTLATTLVLTLSLDALEQRTIGWFVAAGVVAGIAAAIKYNGGISLVMPLAAAAATRPDGTAWRYAGVATAAAGATFLLGAPYTILDLPGFLNGFAALAYAVGTRAFLSGAGVYMGHLMVGVGRAGVAAIALGSVWCLIRAVRENQITRGVILLSFPVLYLYVVSTKDLIFGRYLLPITPPLAIVIAIVVADLSSWLLRQRVSLPLRVAAVTIMLMGVLIPAAGAGVSWPREYGQRTTQDEAYQQIRAFIPSGSRVAVERSVMRLPDSTYVATVVRSLVDRSRDDYLAAGIHYVVATSDVYAPVLAAHEPGRALNRYQDLFSGASECLPPVTPTPDVTGPEIRICHLQTP